MLGEAGFRFGEKTIGQEGPILSCSAAKLRNEASAVNWTPPAVNLPNPAASPGQVPAQGLRTWRPGKLPRPWWWEGAGGATLGGTDTKQALMAAGPSLVLSAEQAPRLSNGSATCQLCGLPTASLSLLVWKMGSILLPTWAQGDPHRGPWWMGIFLRIQARELTMQ